MKNKKFSVLMSVYSKENPIYFQESIDSVINQTLKPSEIVLVEDGKLPKNLEKIIKDYESKCNFLRVIRFNNNRGLGPALNDGIKECKYDYIARVDTDDICRKDRFEIQMNYLIENPDVDVIGSNMIEFDSDINNVVSLKVVPETNDEIGKYIKKRNPMNHPTVIYKKDKVLQACSYEDYPYFEDYHLWAKMVKNNCHFYNIQENLYYFRADSSMYKRRGGKKYFKCIKKLEKSLLDYKIISKREYFTNIFIRYSVSACPNFIRKYIYTKSLRSEKK